MLRTGGLGGIGVGSARSAPTPSAKTGGRGESRAMVGPANMERRMTEMEHRMEGMMHQLDEMRRMMERGLREGGGRGGRGGAAGGRGGDSGEPRP